MKFEKGYVIAALAGLVLGKYGEELLGNPRAKKAYVTTTAAALRAKDGILDEYTCIKQNAQDVYEEAVEYNQTRKENTDKQAPEVFIDLSKVSE